MTRNNVDVDPASFALVLVDIQNGVVGMPLAPYSGARVVDATRTLADYFRKVGAPVILVNLAYPEAGHEVLADVKMPPMPETMPSGWDEIADGVGAEESDIRITKRGWGAFSGTQLESVLRDRGVETVVIAGIATNFGVEQTGRDAMHRGFAVIFASDAATSMSEEHHDFAIQKIMPMIGRVRSVAEIVG